MMKRSAPTQSIGAKSLSKLANQSLFDQLSETIASHSENHVFACGGVIPIGSGPKASGPVTLRWHGSQKSANTNDEISSDHHLSLPTTDVAKIDHLVSYCEPATFGLGDKDVLDKEYRDAVKMDPDMFNISFDLAEHGIINDIGQLLCPSVSSDSKCLYTPRIRAVLYKLNIYSGPSGKFKPHVDTPRGEGHFGSLVICLPSKFEGGQLVVHHRDSAMEFDWSNSENAISWAAFYSDCEHAVLEVTEGHRISLAYNLYTEAPHGKTPISSMDPARIPSYQTVRASYEQPGFMTEGGRLGYYCAHSYAHTHKAAIKNISWSLKGADMAIKEIFSALGCKVSIKPILNDTRYSDIFPTSSYWGRCSDMDEEASQHGEEEDAEVRSYSIVATKLIPARRSKKPWHEKDPHEQLFPHSLEEGIKWLNKPSHKEMAMAYHAYYGNEGSSVEFRYSNLAIIIDVPPYTERLSTQPHSSGNSAKTRKLSHSDNLETDNDRWSIDDAASGCSVTSEEGVSVPGYVGGDCPSDCGSWHS